MKDAGSLSHDDEDDDDIDEERLPLFTPSLLDDFLDIQQRTIIERNEVIAVRPVVKKNFLFPEKSTNNQFRPKVDEKEAL